MSRTSHLIATLDIKCPSCDAEPGERCRKPRYALRAPGDRHQEIPHQARSSEALRLSERLRRWTTTDREGGR